jgi:signal transduction histidine kinase
MICRLGFFLWGLIALLYPLLMYLSYTILITAAFTTVYVMTGTSMMAFYIRLANQGLKAQTEIASLMTRILQHDIRNYVHTANLALEVHQRSGLESCVEIASDALIEAVSFCEKMRGISASLSRLEPSLSAIDIVPLIQSAGRRVARQYSVDIEHLMIDIPLTSYIQSHPLFEELIWNLLDNAFKHGGPRIELRIDASRNGHTSLVINDFAGGIPENIKDYLNSENSATYDSIPGDGLGIAIVKGLTVLCGAKLHVSTRVVGSEVIGTTLHLRFQKPIPI